jgi:hypothetical protein
MTVCTKHTAKMENQCHTCAVELLEKARAKLSEAAEKLEELQDAEAADERLSRFRARVDAAMRPFPSHSTCALPDAVLLERCQAQLKAAERDRDQAREQRLAWENKWAVAIRSHSAMVRERDELRAKIEAYKRGQDVCNWAAKALACDKHNVELDDPESPIEETPCAFCMQDKLRDERDQARDQLRLARDEVQAGDLAHQCVTRVSAKTCAYLADGTKVVVRRGDETVGPAWLDVLKQDEEVRWTPKDGMRVICHAHQYESFPAIGMLGSLHKTETGWSVVREDGKKGTFGFLAVEEGLLHLVWRPVVPVCDDSGTSFRGEVRAAGKELPVKGADLYQYTRDRMDHCMAAFEGLSEAIHESHESASKTNRRLHRMYDERSVECEKTKKVVSVLEERLSQWTEVMRVAEVIATEFADGGPVQLRPLVRAYQRISEHHRPWSPAGTPETLSDRGERV